MKSIKLFLSIIFVVICNTSKAQIRHDAKIQITGIPFGNYGVGYEAIFGEYFSLHTNINISNKIPASEIYNEGINENADFNGFSISPEIRYYSDPDYDCDGMYYGIYYRYSKASLKDNYVSNYNSDIGDYQSVAANYDVSQSFLGLSWGYKKVFDLGLFFDINGGIGYAMSNSTDFSNTDSEDYWLVNDNFATEFEEGFRDTIRDNFDLRFSLSVGWRFNMDD